MSEDKSMNIGLTLRGFEVWAVTPGHYRHYHTLFLRVPGEFPTEAYQEKSGRWVIGYTRPDGERSVIYSPFKTKEEAECARNTYANAKFGRIACQFEVGYKKTDADGNYMPYAFCDANYSGAKAWGTTWDTYPAYAPLKFDLTEEEAKQIIAWREQADKDWFSENTYFLLREKKITDAQVSGFSETAAEFFVDVQETFGDSGAVAVICNELPAAIECLECGTIYNKPGSVDAGAMGCIRCN